MKKIYLLAITLFSLLGGAAAQPVADQGMLSDFHRQNVGKGIFTSARMDAKSPDTSQVLTLHDLSRPLKVRWFLPASLHNLRLKLDTAKYGAPNVVNLKIRVLVNGNEETWQTLNTGLNEQIKTWTTWWYHLVPEKPRAWNTSDDPVEQAFARVVERLGAGQHNMALEFRMIPDGDHGEALGELLATGSIRINADGGNFKAWQAKHGNSGANTAASAGAGATAGAAAAASSYRVHLQNSCRSTVKYSIMGKGQNSYSSLGSNNGTTATLYPGDRVVVGSNTIHTVGPGSDSGTVYICR